MKKTINVKLVHIDFEKKRQPIPNLALMKISSFFKAKGASITFTTSVGRELFEPDFDFVFGSNLFKKTFPRALQLKQNYPNSIIGGYAWDKYTNLPVATTLLSFSPELEHWEDIDYHIYPEVDFSIGYLQRGCRMSQMKKDGTAKPMAEQFCQGCPVPFLEGKPHDFKHITDVWRGEGFAKKILAADNDFFSNPMWEENLIFIRDNKFELSVAQAFNGRLLSDNQAQLFSQVKFMNQRFTKRTIYLAWDKTGDEKTFFRGVDRLIKYGVKPYQISVYFLVGKHNDTWDEDVMYRFERISQYGKAENKWNGLVPYCMVLDDIEQELWSEKKQKYYSLKKFERYVNSKIYQSKTCKSFYEYSTKKKYDYSNAMF